MKAARVKLCKVCHGEFKPFRSTQVVCGRFCAVKFAQNQSRAKDDKLAKAAKAQRAKENKAKLEAMKTKPQLTKEAEREVRRYVRARDFNQPCISCGKEDHEIPDTFRGGKWDAGHYLGKGAYPELRFEPLNIHRQCKSCNGGGGKFKHKERTVSKKYRDGLIQRIGIDRVLWLEGPHKMPHHNHDELRRIRDHYRKLANKIEKENNK